MLKLAISLGILSVFAGCKPSQKQAAKVQSQPAFEHEDDGAIDIPNELQDKAALTSRSTLGSRSRFTTENISKELPPGAKLAIKVRGVKSLQVDIYAKNSLEVVTLALEGSSLKTLDLKAARSSLEIPVKSTGQSLIEVQIPQGEDYGLTLSRLRAKDGGEILSWQVLSR